MNKKQTIITIFICLIFIILIGINQKNNVNYHFSSSLYQVYLEGKTIGYIKDDNELYDLINQEQQSIKEEYQVESVYPPSSFNIVKINTFDNELTSVNDIYEKIEKEDNFTIKGYIITIKSTDEDKKDITINVINKELFENALYNFVTAFVTEEDYRDYLNNTQEDLTSVDSIIEKMYFEETVTIKEGFISVKDEIFTDEAELTQYLLFGDNANIINYKVELGDTIPSIAEKYELNTQEFLIANPTYRDEDTLLVVGSTVNVTLVNPLLTFICDMQKIEEVETIFLKSTIVDVTQDAGYEEISQAGVTGLTRFTEKYQIKNGEPSQEVIVINKEIIREKVDQITIIGKRTYYSSTGSYVNVGIDWGWPTLPNYVITSYYGQRSQYEFHRGIDISGTGGLNSPIYAAASGTVVQSADACGKGCGLWSNGTYVIIAHGYNYYTYYGHLNKRYVEVGDIVTKGQVIGGMGETGRAFGIHLHFGFAIGEPYKGSYSYLNPLTTIYK